MRKSERITGKTFMEIDPAEFAQTEAKKLEKEQAEGVRQETQSSEEELKLGTMMDEMGRFLDLSGEADEFVIDLDKLSEPEGTSVGNPRSLEDQRESMSKILQSTAKEFSSDLSDPLGSFERDIVIAERERELKHQISKAEEGLTELELHKVSRTAQTELTGERVLEIRSEEHDEAVKALRAERKQMREKILATTTIELLEEARTQIDQSKHDKLNEVLLGVEDLVFSLEVGNIDGFQEKVKTVLDEVEETVDDPALQSRIKRRVAYDINSKWGIDDELALDTASSWILTSPLGEGGMGAVYTAEHIHSRRKDAVKFLQPTGGESGDPKYLNRFEQEGKAMAKFQDSGIAKVYDAGYVPEKGAWLSMELLPGGSLEDKIKRGEKFSTDEVYNIGEQLASSLAHAHRENIIHRDIKPDNIIIDKDGRTTIIDFGLAKDIQGRKLAMLDHAYQEMIAEIGYEQMVQDYSGLQKQFNNDEFEKGSTEFSTMMMYQNFINYKKYNDQLQSTAILEQGISDLETALAEGKITKESPEYARLQFYKKGLVSQQKKAEMGREISSASDRLAAIATSSDVERISPGKLASERLSEAGTDLTKSWLQKGLFMGTPSHMPPEQASGQVATEKADVYSLGVVLYQMSSGDLPIKGNNIMALMAAIINQIPNSVSTVNPEIPTALSGLIDKMLAKDPDDRPTMENVLHQLQRQMSREGDKEGTFATAEKQKSFLGRLWGKKKKKN